MKWRKWLENWGMTKLKFKPLFLELEFAPHEPDKDAAWEMYVELVTRVVTQPLAPRDGDEAAALESVHQIFGLTREIIRRHGRDCEAFSRLAVVILNQIVRPFAAKWHGMICRATPDNEAWQVDFREDLMKMQTDLNTYAGMLADMAGVEDMLEPNPVG